MHRIWMGVVVLSAGCSWVLPEPLPFSAENVTDAMIEDAAPPRPDFMIAPPVDLGQRFDMRRPIDRGVIDEGVADDMAVEIDMALADDMALDVDMALDADLPDGEVMVLDEGMADMSIDATPDMAVDPDMSVDMAIDPEPDPPRPDPERP